MNFSKERYEHYFQIKEIFGTPVYFRKSYEMRQDKNNDLYFPAELNESKHFTFNNITKSSVKDFDKINKSTIYQLDDKITVNVSQIRDEKFRVSDAEKKYFFKEFYDGENLD
jgi:hypothetical protein